MPNDYNLDCNGDLHGASRAVNPQNSLQADLERPNRQLVHRQGVTNDPVIHSKPVQRVVAESSTAQPVSNTPKLDPRRPGVNQVDAQMSIPRPIVVNQAGKTRVASLMPPNTRAAAAAARVDTPRPTAQLDAPSGYKQYYTSSAMAAGSNSTYQLPSTPANRLNVQAVIESHPKSAQSITQSEGEYWFKSVYILTTSLFISDLVYLLYIGLFSTRTIDLELFVSKQ